MERGFRIKAFEIWVTMSKDIPSILLWFLLFNDTVDSYQFVAVFWAIRQQNSYKLLQIHLKIYFVYPWNCGTIRMSTAIFFNWGLWSGEPYCENSVQKYEHNIQSSLRSIIIFRLFFISAGKLHSRTFTELIG
jgi:hypothetical protein